MSTFQVQLLGDFLLRSNDTPVTAVNTPRLQALLAYMLLHRSAPQPRRQVAFRLWPDSTEAQARTNLRNLIYLFRQALPEMNRLMQADGPTLEWRADGPWTLDVADFETLIQASRAAQAHARTALEQAVNLYQGDLLPNCYDDWIIAERERLRQMALDALERLIVLLEQEHSYSAAIRYAQRLLRYDPLSETTYRQLMRLHALSGDRAGALRVYQTCVTVLERELCVEPARETQQAYDRLRHINAPATASAVPKDPAPHNLPALLTSFIGRERELAEVNRLLATTRLLVLTGAGGGGKTRLALALAEQQVALFPDGVWLVELAALTDPALVPQAIAAALHVREEPQRPLAATLAESLRSKDQLLLLDNCEHLIDVVARQAQALLNACPRLRILATSREALGIAGETTWRVPSLELPDAHPESLDQPATQLLRAESARLFVERAAAVLPTFTLTNANAAAVAQICRRLDGIPLAIELAAARVKVLTVGQIAERLDDSFRLLASGSRTALPRHQTLRAAIDWSYDLLLEQEQRLFARLAVFKGGWTLEAAEHICAEEPNDPPHALLDRLAHLVDKSIVVVATQPVSEARYSLPEILQQYAWERLTANGMAAVLQRQHASYFLALATAADAELQGAGQVHWLDRLESEHDNLRAALRWALEHAQADLAAQLGGELWRFWWMHGHLNEGRRWLDQVLRHAPIETSAAPQAAAWAKAFQGAGVLADRQGDSVQALAYYERGLALRRALGDQPGMAAALNSMGVGAYYQGDYARAGTLLEESLAIRRGLGDQRRIAVVLSNLGLVALDQGDYDRAQSLFAESLALDQASDNLSGMAMSYNNLGAVARARRDYRQARLLLQQALSRCHELGYTDGIAEALEGLADTLCAAAQPAFAVHLLAAAEKLRAEMHLSLSQWEQARYDRTIAAARAQLDPPAFAAAWAAGRALALDQAIAAASAMTG